MQRKVLSSYPAILAIFTKMCALKVKWNKTFTWATRDEAEQRSTQSAPVTSQSRRAQKRRRERGQLTPSHHQGSKPKFPGQRKPCWDVVTVSGLFFWKTNHDTKRRPFSHGHVSFGLEITRATTSNWLPWPGVRRKRKAWPGRFRHQNAAPLLPLLLPSGPRRARHTQSKS